MSITFACGHCGKSFTVDDKFGGKQGRCKQCKAVVSIPEAETDDFAREREPSPVRRSPTASQPSARPVAARPASPREKVYGIEPEPTSRQQESFDLLPARSGGAPNVLPAARKKRKRGGNSEAGATAVKIIVRVVLGLSLAFGLLIALAVGLPAIRQVMLPGVATKSELEGLIEERVKQTQDLADLLARVKDASDAESSSPRANELIRKLGRSLAKLRDIKVLKRDADSIPTTYITAQNVASTRIVRECERIADVYGAWDALGIDSALKELGAVEASIPGLKMVEGSKPAPAQETTLSPLAPADPPPNARKNVRRPPNGIPTMPPRPNNRRSLRPGG